MNMVVTFRLGHSAVSYMLQITLIMAYQSLCHKICRMGVLFVSELHDLRHSF
jgi:hypothetical protein